MPREYMPTPGERWESSLSALATSADRLAQALADVSDTPSSPPGGQPPLGIRRAVLAVRARMCSMADILERGARQTFEQAVASGREVIDQGELEQLARRSEELRARVASLLEQVTVRARGGTR